MEEFCIWVYRPGVRPVDHFAVSTCDSDSKYLSKITGAEQKVGCADWYNGRCCPVCGYPIMMNYGLIKEEAENEQP